MLEAHRFNWLSVQKLSFLVSSFLSPHWRITKKQVCKSMVYCIILYVYNSKVVTKKKKKIKEINTDITSQS